MQHYVENVLGPVTKQILSTPKEQVSAILTNSVDENSVIIEPGDNNVDYVFH